MKILALKLRRLGDAALWTAALEALKQLKPSILGIAYPKSYDALFEGDPRFDRKYPMSELSVGTPEILDRIRKEKYDAVLNFHASQSSARLCKSTGIPTQLIHFHDRRTPGKVNSMIPHQGIPMSAIERDLNVVRAIGWSDTSPPPKLNIADSFRTEGAAVLREAGVDLSKPLLALSVEASRLAKRWPLENYLSLVHQLKSLINVVVLGEATNPLNPFKTEFANRTHFISTPRLSTLMGCLSFARCYVGSDSGVKHVAAALSIPTVTLFGPESAGEWHGYTLENHRYLQVSVACRNRDPVPAEFSWCGESICPLGSHACMTLISPKQVLQEVQQLLLR